MKKFKKLFLIVMIVAMLSNYFAIIGEIGSQVFASEDSLASSLGLTMSDETLVEENKDNIEKENPYKREMFGDSMDLKSVLDNGERYKGILLANKLLDEEHRKEFEFKSSLELNIKKYAELDSFVIDESEFVITGGERISFSNYVEVKYISIPEEEFKGLFEDNGYILILNDKGEEVATIDSSLTPVDGNYRLDFVKGVSNLKFKVVGLKSNGTLNLEIGKNIAKDIPYTREEIELFDEIIVADKIKATIKDTTKVEEVQESTETKTEEAVTSLSTENTTVDSAETENTATENIVTENSVVDNVETQDTVVETKDIEETKTEENTENANQGLSLSVGDETEKTETTKAAEPKTKETPKAENDSLTLDLSDTEKYYNFIDVINAEKTELHSEESLVLDMASEEKAEEKVEEKVEEPAPAKEEVLEIENEIKLNKSETKIMLEMSSYEINTKEAQDISFNVKLMSNSEKYDIFKDPFVEIIFPAEIEKVEVENVNVFYKNGIDIESYVVEKNSLGQNVLKLALSGVQSDYATGLIDGITVKFDASIETGKMVTNHKSNIMYRYSNEYANHIVYQENALDSEIIDIEFVGEEKLLKSTQVTDLDTNTVIIDSNNEDRKVEKIENKEKLNVHVDSTFINNYGKDINGIVIQGKTIDADIFETIQNETAKSFKISGAITCNIANAEIYYSKMDGTELDSPEWTKDISGLESVKEFKIVLGEDEVMHHGDKIVVSYNLKIDDEIGYNEQITYKDVISYVIDGEKSKDTTIFGIETEKKETSVEDLITYSLIKTDIEKPDSDVVIDIVNNNDISKIEEPIKDKDVPSISDVVEEQKPETINEVIPQEQPNVVEEKDDIVETDTVVENEQKTEDIPIIDTEVDPVAEDANMSDVLKVGTQVLISNNEITNGSINERQIAKVRVAMKNISDKPLTNVRLEGRTNNANIYYFDTFETESDTTYEMVTVGRYEEDTEGNHTSEIDEIPVINPGEEHIFEYQMVVKSLNDISAEDKDFYGKISIQADGMKKADIETEKYKVEDADIELKLMTGNYEDINAMGIPAGTGFAYFTGGFKNISSQKMENIKMHFILPENMHMSPLNAYDETRVMKEYPSVNGSIVEVIIPELNAGEAYTVVLTVSVDELPINISDIYSTVELNVIANGKEYKGNEVTRRVYQVNSEFETKIESDSDGKTLKDGDTVRYTYYVKNVGCISMSKNFDMMLPAAIRPTSVTMYRQDGTVEEAEIDESTFDSSGNFILAEYMIDPEEEIKIVVKGIYNAEDLAMDNNKLHAEVLSDNGLGVNTMVDSEVLEYDSPLYLDVLNNTQGKEEDISQEEEEVNTFYTEYNEESESEPVEEYNDVDEDSSDDGSDEAELEQPVEIIKGEDAEKQEVENKSREVISENKGIINDVEEKRYIEVYVDEDVSIKDYTQGTVSNRYLPLSVVTNQVETPENDKKNSIQGFVWVDKLGEGCFDKQDKFLEGIVVKLFDANSNAIIKATYTDERGRYEFDSLENGKYSVLFSYDNDRYEFVKDVPFDEGSMIVSNISQNKVVDNVNYAISDTATISENKGASINLGLKEKDNFDLTIDGYIEKIGNDDFTYKLENGQKDLEIRKKDSRKDVNIQYKILLKNNGNIDGVVNRISLELPEGASFDPAANPNWEQIGNRIVYNGAPIGVTTDNDNSRVVNIKGKCNDLLKSEIKIEKAVAAKNLVDSNEENNNRTIELKVHKNIDILKIIITSIVITAVFIIIFVINKNGSRITIKALAITYILIMILNILVNMAYGMDYTDLVAKGRYWTGADNEGDVETKANHIQNWATGRQLVNNNDFYDLDNHSGAEAHWYLSEYMTNFYGIGNRSQLMNWNGLFVRDYSKARCNYCMQGSNVSYAGSNNKNFNGYRIVGAIDIGYNNGDSEWIHSIFGTRNGNLYNGGTTGGKGIETNDMAQTLGAVAWNTETNQYNVQNEDESKTRYFYAFRYMFNNIGTGGLSDGRDGHKYYAKINEAFDYSGFIGSTVDAKGYHDDKINGQIPDYSKYYKYINNYQSAFRSAYEANYDLYQANTWISLNNMKVESVGSKLFEDEVYKSYTKNGTTKNAYFIGPIQLKIPRGTSSSPINNRTIVEIKDRNGNFKQYKGDLYVANGNGLMYKYNCGSTNMASVIGGAKFYIPKQGIIKLAGDLDEYQIRFTNSFNYYQARLIYFYQIKFQEYGVSYCTSHDTCGQNKAIMRGRQRTHTTSETITWKPATVVTIAKEVDQINDNDVKGVGYVENGDTIRYNVTLSCIRGKAFSIEFIDDFGNGKLNNHFSYVNHNHQEDVTRDGNKFKYNKTLNKGDSVVIKIRYKVNDSIDNLQNDNRTITNTVKITKVQANVFKEKLSTLTASASVKMKMYKVNISKYITKVEHGGIVTYDREDREAKGEGSKFDEPVNVEVGDKVYYSVRISNSGDDSNKYGSFKVKNTVNTYDDNNFKGRSGQVCQYNKAKKGDKIIENPYENPVDEIIATGNRKTGVNLGSSVNLDGMNMEYNSLGNAVLGERADSQLSVTYIDGVDDDVFADQQYYYDPGQDIPEPTFEYTDPETNETLTTNTPKREGYAFVRWEESEDPSGVSGDIIRSAIWGYSVTYKDGANKEVFDDMVYTYIPEIGKPEGETNDAILNLPRPVFSTIDDPDNPGSSLDVTTPTREGYDFIDWVPDPNTHEDIFEENKVFVAMWEKVFTPVTANRTITYKDGVEGIEIFRDIVFTGQKDGDVTPKPELQDSQKSYTTTVDGQTVKYVFAGWSPDVEEFVNLDAEYNAIWTEEMEDEEEGEDLIIESEDPEIVPPVPEEGSSAEYSLTVDADESNETVTIGYKTLDTLDNMRVWDGNGLMDKANHNETHDDLLKPGKSIVYNYEYYVDFYKNVPTNQVMNFSRIQKLTLANDHSSKTIYYSQKFAQGSTERNLMNTGSKFKSAEYNKIKQYSVVINKSICAITNINGDAKAPYNRNTYSEAQKKQRDVYADVGDLVVYKISIKNNGNNTYGSIKNIKIKDRFVESFVYNEVDCIDYTSMKFKDAWAGSGDNDSSPDVTPITGNGTTTAKNNDSKWQKSGNYYICKSSIDPGKTKYLYLRYKVTKQTKLIEKVLNTASVVEVHNSNDLAVLQIKNSNTSPIYRKAVYNSVINSSDYYTIKRYKAEVVKKVVTIDGVDASTLSELTCEVGDIIEYSITIKNAGTDSSFGTLKKINITDILHRQDDLGKQEFISIEPRKTSTSDGWQTVTSETHLQESIVFVNNANIQPGESITFTVKTRVTLRDTSTERKIYNKAKITDTNNVTNRNNLNIRQVLLGTLESEVDIRYLTYRIDIRKFINGQGKVNGKNRVDLTNKEKYDNPVVLEQTNTGTYVIRIKNTGETVLYGAVIDDILDQGLTFYNAGTEASINRIEYQSREGANPSNVTAEFVKDIDQANRLKVAVKANQTLNPGSILSIYVDFRVDDSNMYLWNLENKVDVIGVVNKHNIPIIVENSDILALDRNDNKDYVRLNDIPINGFVWNDVNKNGVMETGEPKIQGVTVRLIDRTNKKYIETMTNANGKYTFPVGNGYKLEDGSESSEAMVLPGGRVVKATNRNQTTGNYYLPTKYTPTAYTDKYAIYKTNAEKTLESSYINYIVEYEYNGARYRSTNNYAGDSNINQTDFTMKEAYHTDSNAAEYTQMRENFDKILETINYNNAVGSDDVGNISSRLFYDKEGHVSTLRDVLTEDNNEALRMQAYSFVIDPDANVKSLSDIRAGNNNDNTGNIKYLWLNKKNGNNNRYCYEGDTEYLKEINLGLKVQEFDLKLEKDLYQVKTLVGGYEATYDYNQGNNGPVKAADYVGMYATGGKEQNGVFTTNNYQYKFYSSDYEYRNTKYDNLDVRNYMSGTELDVEVTYKITVTNDKNGINDDKQHLYAVVNEITDFYPVEFVKYNKSNNTKTQKYYERSATIADQLLKTRDVNITEAWYIDKAGIRHDLTARNLSNESSHKISYNGVEATDYSMANQNKNFDGYNKMYITGLNGVVLDWNEHFDIYVKYTVDRNTDESRNLKINKGNPLSSVAEINSYSTYEDEYKMNPAGYIDINSNPGNVGYNKTKNKFDVLNNYKEYENDTYRVGLIFDIDEDPGNTPGGDPGNAKVSERAISGFIWDDARSQSVGTGEEIQYVGDGAYIESTRKNSNARVNPLFDENGGYSSRYATKYNQNREKKDNPVGGMKVKLVQLVTVDTDSDGKADRIYEETVNYSSQSEVVTASGQDGKFMLRGFIPGKYIVRYEYGGETTNNANREAMIVYNGQDYKSTIYNEALDRIEITNTNNVESTDGDAILETLTGKARALGTPEPATKSIQSDARDDAIRRLEVNGYSEYVNNDKSNALQISKLQEHDDMDATRKTLYQKRLLENTAMYADTPIFPVRPEDDKYLESIEYSFDEHTGITTSTNRYMLAGIDFGIEYRPEADIDIEKYITEVKVMTSPENVLYDLKFDIHDTDDKAKAIPNTRIGSSVLNKSTSVGVANAQILRNNIQASTKGFIYLNVDADLMQGTTVVITYIINVNNISEIDRISDTLRRILYEESVTTGALAAEYSTLVDREPTGYMPDGTPESDPRHYRAIVTARNKLNSQFNVAIPNGIPNKVRLARAADGSELVRTSDNYYGVYLGNTYYTGTISGRNTAKANGTKVNYNASDDKVSMMKISGILDYVDNDMTFEQKDNASENNYWRSTSSQELAARGFIDEETFTSNDSSIDYIGSWGNLLLNMVALVDNRGRKFDAESSGTVDEQTGASTNNSRLALVVDDSGKGAIGENTKNTSITRFLVPEGGNTNKPASSAYIYINTTKTTYGEPDTKNLQFDNVAEVVEYRTETGRVTTMLSRSVKAIAERSPNITIGNAKLRFMSDERLGDSLSRTNEPDTGITEVVTLVPPTGRYKLSYYLATHTPLLRFFKILFAIMLVTPVLIVVFKKAKNYKKVYK